MKNSLDFSTTATAVLLPFITSDIKVCTLNGADYVSVPTLAEAIGLENASTYGIVTANPVKFQIAKIMLRSEGKNNQLAGVMSSRKTVVIPIARVPELMQYVKALKLTPDQVSIADALQNDLAATFEARFGRTPVAAKTYNSPAETTVAVSHVRKAPVQVTPAVAPAAAVEPVYQSNSGTRRGIIHSMIKMMIQAVPDDRKAKKAMALAKCLPDNVDALSEDVFLDVVVDLALVSK